jgi:hypothetical protein
MRAYIAGMKDAEEPHRKHLRDYWFALTPNGARTWHYWRAAEDAHSIMNHLGITIPAHNDMARVTDFRIEEYGGKFIISCEGPFEPRV